MEEIWKPIRGYEGYYEISNLGRIKAVDRIVKQGNHTIHRQSCIKSQYISKKGYPAVTLCRDRKSVMKYVHKLLAEAFIPNPENKLFVDHINTDKLDCRLENLKWVTAEENSNNKLTLLHLKEDASSVNAIRKRLLKRRELKTKTSPKTVYQYTNSGEFVKEYFSIHEAGRETNTSPSLIRMVLNTQKPAKGYLWTDVYKESV